MTEVLGVGVLKNLLPAQQPRQSPKEILCLHVLRTAGKCDAIFRAALGYGGGYCDEGDLQILAFSGRLQSGIIGKPTAYFRGKARQNPKETLYIHVLRTAGKGGVIFRAALGYGGGGMGAIGCQPLNR